MKRSMLLVLDGEAFRNPALDRELENNGWDPVWADSSDSAGAAGPDLALFAPATLGPQGLAALRSLRQRDPDLPLVALETPGPDREALLAPFAALAPRRLDPAANPDTWPGLLRSFLAALPPASRKFTAEDLFGDILSDLEGSGLPGSGLPGSGTA